MRADDPIIKTTFKRVRIHVPHSPSACKSRRPVPPFVELEEQPYSVTFLTKVITTGAFLIRGVIIILFEHLGP
jgi:hypothetical protein